MHVSVVYSLVVVVFFQSLCYLLLWLCVGIFEPWREQTCLPGFVNIKGKDQPAHLRSLINAFGIHLLESIISKLATSETSLF